jgi:hypothetical protein
MLFLSAEIRLRKLKKENRVFQKTFQCKKSARAKSFCLRKFLSCLIVVSTLKVSAFYHLKSSNARD